MNSINQQQEEDTYKPLSGQEAVEKIRELAKKAGTCFFCTQIKQSVAIKTRPMAVQKIDDQGNLWFLSANSDFLSIYGQASISEDKTRIDELWEPLLKTWFTEGKSDPRISVIKVVPSESYYWDNKHGNAIAFVKMVTGAVLGKTIDDSIEGTLKV